VAMTLNNLGYQDYWVSLPPQINKHQGWL
jgi:hypothetical protein